ncbi:transcriptional regulator [archaeon]|jgi:uncharacterized protein|nr:transcriptional regulator [archaeon]MBT6823824.1 transcriptional regulator [archaeon]MBT7107141.1 transcriptional regulator [archaeon]MBT7297251.1 transcriptional regulator [archaeon]
MKLMLQDVEVRYVIPSLRRELAIHLSKEKLKQKEIAELLEITPAAVSQYLVKKRGIAKFSKRIIESVRESANRILEGNSTTHKELIKLTKLIRDTAMVCEIHKLYDDVPEKCEVCFKNENN